ALVIVNGHFGNQAPLEQAQACIGLAPLAHSAGPMRGINRVASLLLNGDTGTVRGMLAGMDRARQQPDAPVPTPESAVGEALVRVAIGDTTGALAVVRRALDALPVQSPRVFLSEVSMGAIGRSMLLAATWSARDDAPQARRWLSSVEALWAHADAPLRAEVARVRQLVESDGAP
ncbi:MAG: hypothetical protein H3C62_15605, partial [Gemmatimonadaceae bacterium]|nr:hypothetical protein [Gemmatimonadaceae bacterium]